MAAKFPLPLLEERGTSENLGCELDAGPRVKSFQFKRNIRCPTHMIRAYDVVCGPHVRWMGTEQDGSCGLHFACGVASGVRKGSLKFVARMFYTTVRCGS